MGSNSSPLSLSTFIETPLRQFPDSVLFGEEKWYADCTKSLYRAVERRMDWNEKENYKNLEAMITEQEKPMKIPKAWHEAL